MVKYVMHAMRLFVLPNRGKYFKNYSAPANLFWVIVFDMNIILNKTESTCGIRSSRYDDSNPATVGSEIYFSIRFKR